jgi:cation/acetate symporter
MNYEQSPLAIVVFATFVGLTLWLSSYFARRARTAAGYFAAGGGIHWFVNGVAFAGDYLSAASFLGICGMIAFYGYDGFLYSIGYLAGWVVALFVVAEPLKRMGRYTFADALDSRFASRGIKLSVAASTLGVSIFYLIPQMVGAGALVRPLLGLSHHVGVIMVGAIVTLIVVTAGMVSTTYVQFIKGSLLVVFSAVLTVLILVRGLSVPEQPAAPQSIVVHADGRREINGIDQGEANASGLRPVGHLSRLPDGRTETGPIGPIEFLRTVHDSEVVLWTTKTATDADGTKRTDYVPKPTPGRDVLSAGNHPTFKGLRDDKITSKLNFISLMLALFCGTASLPHILIRYYTVKDQAAARKSTIVGIASIGFFYILTLFIGLGAMTSGALDLTDTNMAAPLLARSINPWLFAVISAIAFTTVLGTVSGLIVAAAGAVVHDVLSGFAGLQLNDSNKVRIAKFVSVAVGAVAIALGILFKDMNVTYLVGWAFSVAASANLPSLVMLLFWRGTTKQGITAAVTVGMLSSLGWILLCEDTFKSIYSLPADSALVPFSQPGIVTIPLGFVVLIVVSLLTRRSSERPIATA